MCNALDCVEQFAPGLAATLSVPEKESLLAFFILGLNVFKELNRIGDRPFVAESMADLESAIIDKLQHFL